MTAAGSTPLLMYLPPAYIYGFLQISWVTFQNGRVEFGIQGVEHTGIGRILVHPGQPTTLQERNVDINGRFLSCPPWISLEIQDLDLFQVPPVSKTCFKVLTFFFIGFTPQCEDPDHLV